MNSDWQVFDFIEPVNDHINPPHMIWAYYNPDGNDGNGQFCVRTIEKWHFIEAQKISKTDTELFDNICSLAKQELIDNGTPAFDKWKNDFANHRDTDRRYISLPCGKLVSYLAFMLRRTFI